MTDGHRSPSPQDAGEVGLERASATEANTSADRSGKPSTRREVLATLGGGAAALAGCTGGGGIGVDGTGADGDGAGDDSSDGGTSAGGECPLGGDTVRFDAAGTQFVFNFEYDDGYKEPKIWENNGQIVMDVDAGEYTSATNSLRQEDPSVTKYEPSVDEKMKDEGFEVVTETTFGGETVRAIESRDGDGPVQVRLPHEKGGDNGVEVRLAFGCGRTAGCSCGATAHRESMLRIIDSMEPNHDATL